MESSEEVAFLLWCETLSLPEVTVKITSIIEISQAIMKNVKALSIKFLTADGEPDAR